MQRIFNYGEIRNDSLTPDKELNILIQGMPSYVIICRVVNFQKWFSLFSPPCTKTIIFVGYNVCYILSVVILFTVKTFILCCGLA